MAVAVSSTKAAVAAKPEPVQVKTLDLELVLYTRYYRGGTLYEKGNAYRFKADQAEILLEEVEQDTGRPIWRRYKPQPIARQVQQETLGTKQIVDSTAAKVERPSEDAQFMRVVPTNVINVGDDSELEGVLGTDDGSGVPV